MLTDFFVTKIGMTQAWTKNGKRLAVTRVQAGVNNIVGKKETLVLDKNSKTREQLSCTILEVGFGAKKLKNMTKPLRARLEKSGFSSGFKNIKGARVFGDASLYEVGQQVSLASILEVGDVVSVQGFIKGRGFAGAMKKHGFHGGPATHGQSDRARAVGSIGAGTTPGRVWMGKKMPGHYGNVAKSVAGLVVLHIEESTGEIWLSGPIPGSIMSDIKISKSGKKKHVELDRKASGLPEQAVAQIAEEVAETESAE